MPGGAIVDVLLDVLLVVGPPLLVGLFVLEGLAVGKVLQVPALFVAYVAVTAPDPAVLVGVMLACAVAATVGQWALYRAFNPDAPEAIGLRRRVPLLANLPDRVSDRIGDRQRTIVNTAFERYGAWGVCLLNVVPGVRGLSAIPAGVAGYSRNTFLIAAGIGNLLYLALLAGVGLGILELAGLLGSTDPVQ